MAAIDDVKTEWLAKIAKISDPLRKATATFELDAYVAAIVKLAAAQSHEVGSYSITSRTVTRRDLDQLNRSVREAEQRLSLFVFGDESYMDMGSTSSDL